MAFILLLGVIYGLVSCDKAEVYGLVKTEDSPSDIVRNRFYEMDYGRKLVQRFSDTTKLYWEPQWRNSYDKIDKQGILYSYVPLLPKLRVNKNLRWDDRVDIIGVRKFIIVEHRGKELSYNIATYSRFVNHVSLSFAGLCVIAAVVKPVPGVPAGNAVDSLREGLF
ncbi:hypothetical protein, partial [Hymenobacter elongatus]|uniref:hypothetical protein n=1 Tax=Hymenobacter elongatus TaxID=877208 RepID=UPI001AEBC8EB